MIESECHTLTVKHLLSCGHQLSITLEIVGVDEDPSWVLEEVKKLQWWLNDRISRHDCSLVSEENSDGITPRKDVKWQQPADLQQPQ
jgi:hypothetical protein